MEGTHRAPGKRGVCAAVHGQQTKHMAARPRSNRSVCGDIAFRDGEKRRREGLLTSELQNRTEPHQVLRSGVAHSLDGGRNGGDLLRGIRAQEEEGRSRLGCRQGRAWGGMGQV